MFNPNFVQQWGYRENPSSPFYKSYTRESHGSLSRQNSCKTALVIDNNNLLDCWELTENYLLQLLDEDGFEVLENLEYR